MIRYDTIIVGAGPAGFTAAIFSVRRNMKTLVFGDPSSLSTIEEATWIDNWPGILEISGIDLLREFEEHAKKLGTEIKRERVVEIMKHKNGFFRVRTTEGYYETRTIIMATGTKHKKAMIKGEEQLSGKGVSYCATCDSPLFRGKKVLVIGGGDTALTSALLLDKVGADVTVIHRRGEFRAVEHWRDMVKRRKIKTIFNSVATEIKGDRKVSSVVVQNVKTGKKEEFPFDGVFICIGTVPIAELAKGLGIKLNEWGYIAVDREMRTNVQGVYAAGDCTDNPLKQIITACSDGAIASTAAYDLIQGRLSKGK